ncbi:MAG TPA: winged helix-turn-helix domain-containing protein [Nitrososphaera sp.]|jgi:predicted transcriptional regulator|nr:winged helix-turn-helix domain-containing protein [Nitrososphaera sp.]
MTGRNRIDIISQILETANGGVSTKLKLMYGANLSYAQLKGYLMILSDKGLLSYDLNTKTFKTTEKGLRFLQIYCKLDEVMSKEVLQQQPLIFIQKQTEGLTEKKSPL